MRCVVSQPTGEHVALGDTPGKIGRHQIGMGQKPVGTLWILGRLQLWWCAQSSEELTPSKVDIRTLCEVNMGERVDAEGFLALGFKQRNHTQFAICCLTLQCTTQLSFRFGT